MPVLRTSKRANMSHSSHTGGRRAGPCCEATDLARYDDSLLPNLVLAANGLELNPEAGHHHQLAS